MTLCDNYITGGKYLFVSFCRWIQFLGHLLLPYERITVPVPYDPHMKKMQLHEEFRVVNNEEIST
jgi:hypothetical protein